MSTYTIEANNFEKGWKLYHVIPFNVYSDLYQRDIKATDDSAEEIIKSCNIDPTDDSCHAVDLFTIADLFICCYPSLLRANPRFTAEKLNYRLTTLFASALRTESRAYEIFNLADVFYSTFVNPGQND